VLCLSASSMAVISASKAVCLCPRDLLPGATELPRPSASVVTIPPWPADALKESSVHVWWCLVSSRFSLAGGSVWLRGSGSSSPKAVTANKLQWILGVSLLGLVARVEAGLGYVLHMLKSICLKILALRRRSPKFDI
jgi:hypothetical protein